MTVIPARKADGQRKRPNYILNVGALPQLSEAEKAKLMEVAQRYAFRANDYYLNLIDWDDPDDPIRRLVVPHEQELSDWGRLDASNESAITVKKGVQHKYATTVLLLVNEVCASFCRSCFRKRLFINGHDEAIYDISGALEYIRHHEEVNNVLVTGGDPMVLSTRRLEKIIAALREIDHVRIIRIGTKMPAFNPFRFIDDPELINMLKKYSLPDRRIYFMCHFDHPRELTEEAREAIRLIQEAGAPCANQNPIVRGVSDDPDVMAELWNELSYIGVPQYYIFQNRPTVGNEPYTIPIVEAYFKIEKAKRKTSGLAKRAKYTMSHESGKVEIMGVDDDHIYLKYHRARLPKDEQRFFICRRNDDAYWLDQLQPAPGHTNEYYQDPSASTAN